MKKEEKEGMREEVLMNTMKKMRLERVKNEKIRKKKEQDCKDIH